MHSFDTLTNAAEGIFVLACAIRMFERAEDTTAAIFSALWAIQGEMMISWALWRDDRIIRQMNEHVPQYVEIAAFGLIACIGLLRSKGKRLS